MTVNDAAYIYHDYRKPDPPHQPMYLDPLTKHLRADPSIRYVLDCGCGDGNFTQSIFEAGYAAYGIDMSDGGIQTAKRRYPNVSFAKASVYEDLRDIFPDRSEYCAIVAVEVIEHLYSPKMFVQRAREALRPGGRIIITTPYWGYWKNILLAISGRTDRALTPLWEGGHIKHWSYATITELFSREGFRCVGFHGAGRPIPYLWSGMLLVFQSTK